LIRVLDQFVLNLFQKTLHSAFFDDFKCDPIDPRCAMLALQQGLFAPRALPRFTATTDPSVTLSPSTDFPVSPVIRFSLPRIFSTGRGGFLQLLNVSLSSCRRYRPARASRRISQSATVHVAFTSACEVRPLGVFGGLEVTYAL
jgi:hypothetical protein